jgi:hypothetical protein
MKSNTQSVTLQIEPERVFGFVSDPQNLPAWALAFCKGIRKDGESWRVETPNGEVLLYMVTDRGLGVVDFHLEPAPGVRSVAASRVVPNGAGAEYVFTQFQPPGLPDEAFEAQVRALGEELLVLRALLEGRARPDMTQSCARS